MSTNRPNFYTTQDIWERYDVAGKVFAKPNDYEYCLYQRRFHEVRPDKTIYLPFVYKGCPILLSKWTPKDYEDKHGF